MLNQYKVLKRHFLICNTLLPKRNCNKLSLSVLFSDLQDAPSLPHQLPQSPGVVDILLLEKEISPEVFVAKTALLLLSSHFTISQQHYHHSFSFLSRWRWNRVLRGPDPCPRRPSSAAASVKSWQPVESQ